MYSIIVWLSCLRAMIASVHPLPFLKPIGTSLSRGSTLYRVRYSRIFAYILPVWLRRDIPRHVLQSFLLPFFFQTGAMTARCQSSGTFLSVHAFWNIVVSQVVSVSLHARTASVVMPSIHAALFFGLVFNARCTSDLRMFGFCVLDT